MPASGSEVEQAANGWAQASDAQLATAVAAGEPAALAAMYERYGSRLWAFCQGMLRNSTDAEDCLQDVFVLAATRLGGLREPERLRAWLFAVARNECLRRLDKTKRETPVDAVPDQVMPEADAPAAAALDSELARLLADAIAGLSPRDRLVLDLGDRQGLPTDELGAALGIAAGSAYKLLTRARTTARRSIGALLVARTNRGRCGDLDAILAGWDGRLSPLLRKRIARHVETCTVCAEQERRVAAPAALLGIGATALPVLLRSRILAAATHARTAGAAGAGGPAAGAYWPEGWPPRDPRLARLAAPRSGRGARRGGTSARTVAVIAAVAAVVVVAMIVTVTMTRVHTVATRGVLRTTSAPAAPVSPASSLLGPAPQTTIASAAPPTTVAPTSSAPATAATSAGTAPRITVMSVTCSYFAADRQFIPVLTWATRNATGIALSVDNPAIVGSYGNYGSSGTLQLPPNGCNPKDPTQIYTITTRGGTGPAAHQTIRWTPPTNLVVPSDSSSASASPSPSPTPTSPTTTPPFIE